MPVVCHFLLVYDLKEQRVVSHDRYEDAREAAEAYAELERRCADGDDVEIVLVGADSWDTIQHTHASYFAGTVSAPSKFLAGT